MAAPPILADITVNGRAIKAIAQPTKQAWLYVFDRTNGQPVWPIVERPVPKGDVPGEWYSPTQPFVTKPPAYDRQGVSVDDLIDFTPELRAEALKFVSRYKLGPLFTPAVVSKVDGPLATLHMPLAGGGVELARRLVRSGHAHRCTCSRRARRARSASFPRRKATTSAGCLVWRERRRRAAAAWRRGGTWWGAGCAGRGRCRRSRQRGRRGRGRWRRTDGPGTAVHQTALRTHHRHRLEQRRHRLAGRAR